MLNQRKSIEIGVIGSGQCGGNLAEEFSTRGYDALALNSSHADLRPLTISLEGKLYIGVGGIDGAGQDVTIGRMCLEENANQVKSRAMQMFENCEHILLTAGMGGGTGSNVATLAGILEELNKPMSAMITIPVDALGSIMKINALNAINQLIETDIIDNIILIDNQMISKILPNVSLSSFYKEANSLVVGAFDELNRLSRNEDYIPLRTFDGEDFKKIFQTPGMVIYGCSSLSKEDFRTGGRLISRLRTVWDAGGLFASGFDYSTATMAAIVLIAPEEIMESSSANVYDTVAEYIKDITIGAGIYIGLFQTTEGDSVKIYTMLSGLDTPDRLDTLLEQTKEESEELSLKRGKKLSSLNLGELAGMQLFPTVRVRRGATRTPEEIPKDENRVERVRKRISDIQKEESGREASSILSRPKKKRRLQVLSEEEREPEQIEEEIPSEPQSDEASEISGRGRPLERVGEQQQNGSADLSKPEVEDVAQTPQVEPEPPPQVDIQQEEDAEIEEETPVSDEPEMPEAKQERGEAEVQEDFPVEQEDETTVMHSQAEPLLQRERHTTTEEETPAPTEIPSPEETPTEEESDLPSEEPPEPVEAETDELKEESEVQSEEGRSLEELISQIELRVEAEKEEVEQDAVVPAEETQEPTSDITTPDEEIPEPQEPVLEAATPDESEEEPVGDIPLEVETDLELPETEEDERLVQEVDAESTPPSEEELQVEDVVRTATFETYEQIYQTTVNKMDNIADAEMLTNDDISHLREMVILLRGTQFATERSSSSPLLYVAKSYPEDEFLSYHSVNVCILSLKIGEGMDYSDEELSELGLAALIHDIGMFGLPDDILYSQEQINDAQLTAPIKGAQIVEKIPGVPEVIPRGILQAYEREDGSGYPNGITGDDIHNFAKIIAVADTYESLSHARPHKDALLPYDAMKDIIGRSRGELDYKTAKALVNLTSVYPIGSYVLLNNNEIAIVLDALPNSPFHPTVKVVYSDYMDVEDGEVFNLKETSSLNIIKPVPSSVNEWSQILNDIER